MADLSGLTVSSIVSADTVFSPRGRRFEMKNRPYYGLTLCMEGQITYFHRGASYLSDSSRVLLLPMGENYSLRTDRTGRFPVINFSSPDFSCREFLSFPVENAAVLLQDYERIHQLFLFQENRLEVFSLFYHLLHQLAAPLRPSGVLSPALEFLQNHFADASVNAACLARLCDFSESHFRRIFTASMGVSPGQYLIGIRLSKAKQLLSEGHLNISDVSNACGFQNPYHFSRLFRKKTGMTPGEYRKANRLSQI